MPPRARSDSLSLRIFRSSRRASRKNINPHSYTFSIAHRVRRRRRRPPSSRVIENPRRYAFGFSLRQGSAADFRSTLTTYRELAATSPIDVVDVLEILSLTGRQRSRTEPRVYINQLISNSNLSAPLIVVVDCAYDKDAHNADSVGLARRVSIGPTCHGFCFFSFRSAVSGAA